MADEPDSRPAYSSRLMSLERQIAGLVEQVSRMASAVEQQNGRITRVEDWRAVVDARLASIPTLDGIREVIAEENQRTQDAAELRQYHQLRTLVWRAAGVVGTGAAGLVVALLRGWLG